MPRVYKTKPGSKKRTPINIANLKNAIKAYLYDGNSLRSSARMFNVSYMTLRRYAAIQKEKKQEINHIMYHKAKIFTHDEEVQLVNYALEKSDSNGNLSSKVMRKLAFEFATLKKKKMPPSWLKNGEAGYDWMWGFSNRHKKLLLCEAIKLKRYNSSEEKKSDNYETVNLDIEIKMEANDKDSADSETIYHEEDFEEQENDDNTKSNTIFLRSLPELEDLLSSNSAESGLGLGPSTEIHKSKSTNTEKGINCASEPRNEFDAFCESLAIQLKNMPLRQALLCQERLMKVMIEARLQSVEE